MTTQTKGVKENIITFLIYLLLGSDVLMSFVASILLIVSIATIFTVIYTSLHYKICLV